MRKQVNVSLGTYHKALLDTMCKSDDIGQTAFVRQLIFREAQSRVQANGDLADQVAEREAFIAAESIVLDGLVEAVV